jgi:SAM-dependent methyltransferase
VARRSGGTSTTNTGHMTAELQARTIADFGEQWTSYPDSEGFFGSAALFNDFLNPLVSDRDVAGRRVAEIGAGAGRFVNVLAQADARHIVAIEPSDAFGVLCQNTARFKDRITYFNVTGDRLPRTGDLDYVFAIGVLHHIPDPGPVVAAAFDALRSGGRLAVWLYGREGNTLYLLLCRSLWWLTRRLPHRGLDRFVRAMYPMFWCYLTACRWIPLPLAVYMRRVMLPLTPAKRKLVIYDQLNPAYAKYYTQDEARDLLVRHRFTDIRLHHRHGISWTVVGTKP